MGANPFLLRNRVGRSILESNRHHLSVGLRLAFLFRSPWLFLPTPHPRRFTWIYTIFGIDRRRRHPLSPVTTPFSAKPFELCNCAGLPPESYFETSEGSYDVVRVAICPQHGLIRDRGPGNGFNGGRWKTRKTPTTPRPRKCAPAPPRPLCRPARALSADPHASSRHSSDKFKS